jgi:hypothetical protein
VAASVATGSWKGTARKYFVTTANGSFDFFGVRWNATQPTLSETDADGMSAWFACHGASAWGAASSFIETGPGFAGSKQGLRRTTASGPGEYISGGGTVAVSATSLPTDGTTKFSFGGNYRSADSSEVFYGLESGSLASDGTAGSDGGFGSGATSVYAIGGSAGQGNQPFSPYVCCVFDRKLTLAEMQSLHDDWFGTLINAPVAVVVPPLFYQKKQFYFV